jgi:excisionase family DNA binding protein
MRDRLSPKQVARAIGVSESSLKRWCDRGLIPFEKTAGGHRRIVMCDVVSFLRNGGYKVIEPDVLQLPATTGQTVWTLDQARERFVDAVIAGQEDASRQILFDLYLSGHSITAIADQIVAAGFKCIGHRWECGSLEVYEERRGCELCLRVIHELRTLQEPPAEDAPLAIGGTLDGDPYTLAVSTAELVLREGGYRAMSLGHMLPFSTIHKAIEKHSPRLLWISISAIREPGRFVAEMNTLSTAAAARKCAVVLGGRALRHEVREQIRYSAYCDNFTHLLDFAHSLRG